jgi:hypothetical protein
MYDLTAWGLPYAYNAEAYALTERAGVDTTGSPPADPTLTGDTDRPYAYVTPWRSRADARFVAALLQESVRVRFATESFTVGDRSYAPGTLLLTRANNANRLDRFDATVRRVATAHDQSLHALQTGFTDEGPDLGSGSVGVVDGPKVAVLSNPPTSKYRVGEVWHFFDHQIEYPATLLPADEITSSMLDDVDVLVLPDGDYETWLTDERATMVTRWVRAGGRLIALGAANEALAGRSAYTLTKKETASPADTASDGAADPSFQSYGAQQRTALSKSSPGSIHRVRLDGSHPLAFGLESPYFTLKRNSQAFAYLGTGGTVGVLETSAPVSGFMGHQAQQQIDDTLIFGAQRLGEGRVVYLVDNPVFRGFWYGGHVLFSNAVFFVGNS